MTETIQQLKEDIAVLQEKLQKLEELQRTKSPAEEAFKKVYYRYPDKLDDKYGSAWDIFEKGYNASKVSETPQTPEQVNTFAPKELEELVREGVKWCEEHQNESVEDYLRPQTPEQIEKSLRTAFGKAQQTEKWKEIQKLIDEEDNDKNFKNSLDLIKEWGEKNKPPTLYEILMEWWINHLDMEQSDEEIVDGLVDMIGEKFIPPSNDRNGYEWEKCLKMMRDKLR